MLVFALISVLAIRFPEVEDPIPAQIGLGHIFAFAAGGGVLGGISFMERHLVSVNGRPARAA